MTYAASGGWVGVGEARSGFGNCDGQYHARRSTPNSRSMYSARSAGGFALPFKMSHTKDGEYPVASAIRR